MKCESCGREITEELEQSPCGRCVGGCRKVHCPYCGHENPATPKYLRRFAQKQDGTKKD